VNIKQIFCRLVERFVILQGWARDVKARDRDETETLTSRDRDVGFTSRDETLKFRDETETFVALET